MNTGLRDSLAQVQELLSVATAGEWFSESVRGDYGYEYFQLRADDNKPFLDTLNSEMAMIATEGDEDGSYSYDETGLHDTRAIAAAVNWLRKHGPELMKRLEGKDGR